MRILTVATMIFVVLVIAILFVVPAAVMLVNGIVPSDCGRACLDPGVTENPLITLIGE